MNVLGYGAPRAAGGPMIMHSGWWVRAHWGRAFEILALEESGLMSGEPEGTQGAVLMRRREVELTPEDLEAPEPDEPRELRALAHNLAQTRRERAELNRSHDEYAQAYHAARAEVDRLRRGRGPRERARRLLRAPRGQGGRREGDPG